jgi:thiamine biosynthesis protein ThiS
MVILVNGEEKELDKPLNIRGLLQLLNLQEERIAVEVNLEIVDRQLFPSFELKEGDKVEVISFVGGG